MRTIEFRGKDIKTGDFRYGDLISGQGPKYGKIFILPQKAVYPSGCNNLDGWEVHPETVGQFTGLTDKNGNKIFEGDVIHTDKGYAGDYFVEESKSKIIFDEGEFLPEPISKTTYFLPDGNWWLISTVIGNIHDNPIK